MARDIINKVTPLKNVFSDSVEENLYKIFINVRSYKNYFIGFVTDLLFYIDKNEVNFQSSVRKQLDLILKALGAPQEYNNFTASFVVDKRLVEMQGGKLVLTPNGRLFLMSDSNSRTVDTVRYIWEELDWNAASGCEGSDRFLQNDARRYVACLLSQLNNADVSQEERERKSGDFGFGYLDNFYVLNELINDEYMKYILVNILEPAGLINITHNKEMGFLLTEAGRKVFEYYSYNMIEEYLNMVDECWECYDRENFQEALDTACSIIKVAGNVLEAYNVIGCVHIKKGEYDRAKAVFTYAIELSEREMAESTLEKASIMETYISMYYNLGLCDFYLGNHMKALHTFTMIRKTLPYTLDSLEAITSTIKKLILV